MQIEESFSLIKPSMSFFYILIFIERILDCHPLYKTKKIFNDGSFLDPWTGVPKSSV